MPSSLNNDLRYGLDDGYVVQHTKNPDETNPANHDESFKRMMIAASCLL